MLGNDADPHITHCRNEALLPHPCFKATFCVPIINRRFEQQVSGAQSHSCGLSLTDIIKIQY